MTALRNGRPDITEDILIEFLEVNPDHVNAIKMLAEGAIAQDRNEDAAALLERCLELAPDFSPRATACARRSICRTGCTRRSRISTSCSRRTRSTPQFRTMKASLLGQMGEDKEALALFRGAGARISQPSASWVSYGHALKGAGQAG